MAVLWVYKAPLSKTIHVLEHTYISIPPLYAL